MFPPCFSRYRPELVKGITTEKILERSGGDDLVVYNNQGSIIVNKNIDHIYENNEEISRSLSKGFDAIESSEDIDGVEFVDENHKKLISIDRKDFRRMTASNKHFEEISQIENRHNVSISIRKLVFDEGFKWDFIYNGSKISAYVNDGNFNGQFGDGSISFAAGDKRLVDLEVKKVYDNRVDDFITKSIKVTKVIRHIPRSKQIDLL